MAKITLPKITAGAYVYVFVIDGVDRYIGKGTTDRYRQHIWKCRGIMRRRADGKKVTATLFYNKLIKAIQKKASIEVRIVRDGMSEGDAYNLETEEIIARPVGQLWNSFRGGFGLTRENARALWTEQRRSAAHLYWSDPARKKRQSDWAVELNKSLWSDDSDFRSVQRKRVKAESTTPEGRKELSRRAKGMWTDEFKKKRSRETTSQNHQRWSDPAKKAILSNRMEAQWKDGAWRDSRSKGMKEKWANPEWRAAQLARMAAAANVENSSSSAKMLWQDPDYREKQRVSRLALRARRLQNQ